MEKLFQINNKDFNKVSTTVLYTSSYNYLDDAKEFIHHNIVVITKDQNANINNIPEYLLKSFNCLELLNKPNLTRIDNLKITILDNLNNKSDVYVFLNVLTYLDNEFKKRVINYLKEQNKIIINYTEDIEEALLLNYIIVIHDNKIIMEGYKEDILKEEKILKKLGFNLPFIVELSNGLKYYGLIDKLYYDNESLVSDLWN